MPIKKLTPKEIRELRKINTIIHSVAAFRQLTPKQDRLLDKWNNVRVNTALLDHIELQDLDITKLKEDTRQRVAPIEKTLSDQVLMVATELLHLRDKLNTAKVGLRNTLLYLDEYDEFDTAMVIQETIRGITLETLDALETTNEK